MAPVIRIGGTMPVSRERAINVTVSQCPIATSPTKRSPRGFQPLRRTMLVVTAVWSINPRRGGSSNPCSRIKRRRARATSARLRSAARRLFFDSDAVASKEPGERAPASWDSPLVQSRNNLTQREVPLLTDEGENPMRVLLQWRSTPSTGYWLAGPVVAKALHPPDRGTDADVELLGCFTSGSSSFHEANDSHAQLTRILTMHWATLRRINALDSLLRRALGIPIHSGRDVL